MRFRTIASIALVVAGSVASCGPAGDDDSRGAPSSDAAGGGLRDAVEVAAAAPGAASAGACDIDRRNLATAVELYRTMEGAAPTDQNDLVEAGLVAEPSARYDITDDGDIVAIARSGCS